MEGGVRDVCGKPLSNGLQRIFWYIVRKKSRSEPASETHSSSPFYGMVGYCMADSDSHRRRITGEKIGTLTTNISCEI